MTPPTAELIKRLAELGADLPLFTGEPRLNGVPRRARGQAEGLAGLLKRALVRDVIQRGRPEGCWCLGLGGKNPRYVPSIGEEPEFQTWDTFCVCPDGERAREDVLEHRKRLNIAAIDYRINHAIGKGTPFGGRYEGATFQSYLEFTRARFGAPANAGHIRNLRQWLNDPTTQNVYLYGPNGTGKTYWMVAMYLEVVRKFPRISTRLKTAEMIFGDIKKTYNVTEADGKGGLVLTDDVIAAYSNVDVLFVDELNGEHTTPWSIAQFLAIENRRYVDHMAIVVTSNLDPSQLGETYGPSIAERILEGAIVCKVEGPCLRDPV